LRRALMASIEKITKNNVVVKQILESLIIKQEAGKKEFLEVFLTANNLEDAKKVMTYFLSRRV
jgi:hypothetical protein